jgi:hypothetical protein
MSAEREHLENHKGKDLRQKTETSHLLESHSQSHKKPETLKAITAHSDNGKAAQKHLPQLEIIDHKKLQAKVVDGNHKHKAEERLQAAHSLYKNDHKQFSQNDNSGKNHHYKIVEQKNEKTQATRIAVFEIDGKNARLTLDGTMDKSGKFAAAKEQSRQENKAENKQEIKPEQEARHRERRNKEDDSPSHRNPRQQRDHAGESHRRKLDSYEQAEPIKAIDSQRARQAFAQGANLNLPSDRLIKLDNGMVYLRSKLAVDADGGSDWRNDRYGQATTSLTNADGSALDANRVNYFVLPMTDEYKQMGIKLGDLAWVRNTRTGKMVAAIFGDHGPKTKIGEGSQALCRALGLSGDPNHGGTDKKEIEFLIQPKSGNGKGDIAKDHGMMVARLAPPPQASSKIGERIVASAQAAEGEKLWRAEATATRNGRLGCAISTSEVLAQAGLDINKETGACALVEQLQDRGWNKVAVSQAQPGDVIYGAKPGKVAAAGGGNAHVGIVGERQDGKLMVYANVSATGRWTHESANRAFSPNRFGNQIWAFRPPQSSQA